MWRREAYADCDVIRAGLRTRPVGRVQTSSPCLLAGFMALDCDAHAAGRGRRGTTTRNQAMTTSKPRACRRCPAKPGPIRCCRCATSSCFPHMIVPLFVGREKSIKALEEVMRSDTFILLATQKNASDDDPATDSIYEVGTLASVLQLLKLPDGTVKVLVEGAERAKVDKLHRPHRILRGRRRRARRRLGRAGRGRGAGALGRQRVRELREAQQEGVAGSRRRRPADRGLRQARRHRRLASRGQDPRQAGDPGDADRSPSGWRRCSA